MLLALIKTLREWHIELIFFLSAFFQVKFWENILRKSFVRILWKHYRKYNRYTLLTTPLLFTSLCWSISLYGNNKQKQHLNNKGKGWNNLNFRGDVIYGPRVIVVKKTLSRHNCDVNLLLKVRITGITGSDYLQWTCLTGQVGSGIFRTSLPLKKKSCLLSPQ